MIYNSIDMFNIWQELPRPLVVMAPMEGVTDIAFRQLIDEIGRPDLKFSEFVNATGMFSRGSRSVMMSLEYEQSEKPLVAQLWGTNIDDFRKAARLVAEKGFDGVDINMGCPVRKIINKGSCSALIKNKSLAQEIIKAVKEGVGGRIPVSVKTRIGFDQIVTDEWISFLLECGIDVLTVHGRTTDEMSSVPCHWDEIGRAVEIRNQMGVNTLIIGNGDVESLDQVKQKVSEYGVDGVMIGRGVLHNPWVFEGSKFEDHTKEEKINLLRRHAELFFRYWPNDECPFVVLRRFFKIYLRGFVNANELRDQVMSARSWEEVERILGE